MLECIITLQSLVFNELSSQVPVGSVVISESGYMYVVLVKEER